MFEKFDGNVIGSESADVFAPTRRTVRDNPMVPLFDPHTECAEPQRLYRLAAGFDGRESLAGARNPEDGVTP